MSANSTQATPFTSSSRRSAADEPSERPSSSSGVGVQPTSGPMFLHTCDMKQILWRDGPASRERVNHKADFELKEDGTGEVLESHLRDDSECCRCHRSAAETFELLFQRGDVVAPCGKQCSVLLQARENSLGLFEELPCFGDVASRQRDSSEVAEAEAHVPE